MKLRTHFGAQTAGYFFVHAGHRETAIDHAIQAIRNEGARRDVPSDVGNSGAVVDGGLIVNWVVESLIQGAWMREYHEWEKATKSYFEKQHLLNGSVLSNWEAYRRRRISHVGAVRDQLSKFTANVPDRILKTIDDQRKAINAAKHREEYFVTEKDYRLLIRAVEDFWNELGTQEEYIVEK